MSQAVAGELFGVSQSTVSRVVRHVLPLIEQVTCLSRLDLVEASRGRGVLVDGTYVPTGNRLATGRVNYSGKRGTRPRFLDTGCDHAAVCSVLVGRFS